MLVEAYFARYSLGSVGLARNAFAVLLRAKWLPFLAIVLCGGFSCCIWRFPLSEDAGKFLACASLHPICLLIREANVAPIRQFHRRAEECLPDGRDSFA
jgi:hypothetical protein